MSIPYPKKGLGLLLILVMSGTIVLLRVLWCQAKKKKEKKKVIFNLIVKTSAAVSPGIHEQSEQDTL